MSDLLCKIILLYATILPVSMNHWYGKKRAILGNSCELITCHMLSLQPVNFVRDNWRATHTNSLAAMQLYHVVLHFNVLQSTLGEQPGGMQCSLGVLISVAP